jgi:hypothetical protein
MPKEDKKHPKYFLMPLIILFSFLLPLLFLFLGIVVFRVSNKFSQTLNKEEIVKTEEKLLPSQILKNKSEYHDKRIWLRGKIALSPVVCEKKACPDDPCCGCPEDRDLILEDVGTILKSGGEERLRLKDIFTGLSLCKKKASSCDYDCEGWIKGAVYDVYGRFYAETPPSGWQKSLNYYFQAEGKNLIKNISPGESLRNLYQDLKERFQNFKFSSQFVLP